MLAVPAVVSAAVADLIRFDFYANHIGSDGGEMFTWLFTLTSLQSPFDELVTARG